MEKENQEAPVWGKSEINNDGIVFNSIKQNAKLVPNVKNMGAKDAVYLLEGAGLKVRLNGIGRVTSQSIPPGSYLHKGQTIVLTLK